MRVLMVAPPHVRVARSAPGPGGQIALLAEALAARGHAITVCTSESAEVNVQVRRYKLPEPEHEAEQGRLDRFYALRALTAASGYDLVHSFAGPELAALTGERATPPLLATLWDIPGARDRLLWRGFSGAYVTASWAQASRAAELLPHATFAGVVYPPIDVESLPYEPEKDAYLLTLGPVGPESGTDIAIAAARKTETPLLIAGPVAPGAAAFFEHEVRPHIDGCLIQYRPAAGVHERRRLLARARALLLTARAARPWDLAAAEALAMGTPIVALDRGSVRELVVHAETGFVAEDLPGLVSGIDRLDSIDPRACRRRAERCWDVNQAAAEYETVYARLCKSTAAPLPTHPELEALDPRQPVTV